MQKKKEIRVIVKEPGTALLVGVDGEEFTDWPLGRGRGEAIFGEAGRA